MTELTPGYQTYEATPDTTDVQAIATLPKSLSDTRAQFEQLLAAFDIPLSLSGQEKLARLRAIPVDDLVGKVMTLDLYTFRPVNDGGFFRQLLCWMS